MPKIIAGILRGIYDKCFNGNDHHHSHREMVVETIVQGGVVRKPFTASLVQVHWTREVLCTCTALAIPIITPKLSPGVRAGSQEVQKYYPPTIADCGSFNELIKTIDFQPFFMKCVDEYGELEWLRDQYRNTWHYNAVMKGNKEVIIPEYVKDKIGAIREIVQYMFNLNITGTKVPVYYFPIGIERCSTTMIIRNLQRFNEGDLWLPLPLDDNIAYDQIIQHADTYSMNVSLIVESVEKTNDIVRCQWELSANTDPPMDPEEKKAWKKFCAEKSKDLKERVTKKKSGRPKANV